MVEGQKIIVTDDVVAYLDELVKVLYEKEYFGFIDSAINYVVNVYGFIETIPREIHKKSPVALVKYGTYYSFFNTCSCTTWYSFLKKRKTTRLLRAS
ncbi:MAG TPA: hypothetical protein VJ880_05080 [Allomuricauda sp.]|nr:hypothetical protein [Allomuricauda sp.]